MHRAWLRRLVAASVPVLAIAGSWAGLQRAGTTRAFDLVAVLALLVALPASFRLRIALAVTALAALTAVVAGSSASRVRDVADRGLTDINTTTPPFDAANHHELYVLVVLGAGALCLAVAVVAGNRPFVAAAITVAGMGFPATVMPARNTVTAGAFSFFVALWPIVVAGARDRRALARGSAALVGVAAAAVVVAGAGARPTEAALDWQNWELFGQSGAQRTVALVWNANYLGFDFPREKTTVLRITAPHRALYWRATTLDLFSSDHWVESLYTTAVSTGTRDLPGDALVPRAAADRAGWIRQDVDVRAVLDDHVVGAGQPMRIEAGAANRIHFFSSGVIRALGGLGEMRRYSVWSYVARPTPAALDRSPPTYSGPLFRYLDVGNATVPAYGSPGRTAPVENIFRDERTQPLWPYRPLWRRAQALTARTRSPYEATLAIERWLRSDGGFTYDEHPPAPAGLPPLVDFVERTKLGYCQHFAGSMALMLRYLGIPARVAVGFTSGTWKDGRWTITDHDAHAWVEAWFAGYGWLTFDPTPGRGTLSATYTNASDSADAIAALGTGRFLGLGARGATTSRRGVAPVEQPTARSVPWKLIVPFAALAAALVALATTKSLRRRRRASARDPRGRASAARAELAAFIRDQGSPVAASASVGELVLELRRLGIGSDAFAAAFSRARYGPPAGAARAADETRQELRRVLSLLRDRLGPGRRIRGFLAVKSLRGG